MRKINVFLTYLKHFLLSKYGYFLIIILFFTWLVFFDSDNYVKRWRLIKENSKIAEQNKKDMDFIKQTEKRIKDFSTNKDELEKYARENYGMKAPNEDVFLFDE